jgi:hypothetical protein
MFLVLLAIIGIYLCFLLLFKFYLFISGSNKTVVPNNLITSTSHLETSHFSNNNRSSQNNDLQQTVLNIFKQSIFLIVMFSLYNIAVSGVIFLIYCNNAENTLHLILSKVELVFITLAIIVLIVDFARKWYE